MFIGHKAAYLLGRRDRCTARNIFATRLQCYRRWFEVAFENVICNANPKGDSANGEKLARAIRSRSHSHVFHICWRLEGRRSIGIWYYRSQYVFRCKGIKSPVDTKEDTAHSGIENGCPQTWEVTNDSGAYCSELVRNRYRGVVRLSQITIDSVQLVRDEIESNVVWPVGCKGQIVTSFIVEPCGLETCTSEGSMAGLETANSLAAEKTQGRTKACRIRGERWLESQLVGVCRWCTNFEPKGIDHRVACVLPDT